MTRPLRALLATVLLATASPAAEVDLEEALAKVVGQSHWYGIYVQGEKSGYALTQTVADTAAGREAVTFHLKMRLKLVTLGQKQDVRVFQHRTYFRTGELHEVSSRFKTQLTEAVATGVVRGDKMVLTSRIGGLTNTEELPKPQESLRDFLAADRLVRPDAKIGDQVTVSEFDPMMLKELQAVLTLKDRKTITFNGVPTRVFVINTRMPALRVSTDMYVDERGVPLELTIEGMFTLRLEPEEKAKDVAYSSDVIRMGCVELDPHPPHVSALEQLRLRVRGIDDEGLLLDDGRQEWAKEADGSYVVVARSVGPEPQAAVRRPVEDEEFAPYLRPTPFIQCQDERMKAQATRIVGQEADAWAAAKAINRWVHQNLEKVGTAALSNAVETLKARKGDCTEHTVLFVALARAAGVPAREVAGVSAIDGGDGLYYHAWPEVWVGRWVAMDPTLGQDVADATHIKFAVGGAEQIYRIVALFGRLEAQVLTYEPERPPHPDEPERPDQRKPGD